MKFDLIQANLNEKHNAKQLKQYTKSAMDSPECVLRPGSLVYVLMPSASRLHDTRSKKIVLNWLGPMIIYSLDGTGNAILQRLDGKLLCNIISLRRLKPAYIMSEKGKILTSNDDLIQQLSTSTNPFAPTLKRGLLPDYLFFADAKGMSHPPPDSLFVMSSPLPEATDPFISLHEQPLDITQTSHEVYRNHLTKQLSDPYTSGIFTIIRARFQHGNLELLLSNDMCASNQHFYVAIIDSIYFLPTLLDIEMGYISVKGSIHGSQTHVCDGKACPVCQSSSNE